MLLGLDELKQYLRVDYPDDDEVLTDVVNAATDICMDVIREDKENQGKYENDTTVKLAVMYAAAYLYEHREEADHKELTLTLRALLSGIRREGF